MLKIDNDNVAFFDVDDTLIHHKWDADRNHEQMEIAVEGSLLAATVVPHYTHIKRLKHHKQVGNAVVVWSRSGVRWAEAVVKALDLEQYVDLVSAKPFYYYDDKKCCQILGEYRYFVDVDYK